MAACTGTRPAPLKAAHTASYASADAGPRGIRALGWKMTPTSWWMWVVSSYYDRSIMFEWRASERARRWADCYLSYVRDKRRDACATDIKASPRAETWPTPHLRSTPMSSVRWPFNNCRADVDIPPSIAQRIPVNMPALKFVRSVSIYTLFLLVIEAI